MFQFMKTLFDKRKENTVEYCTLIDIIEKNIILTWEHLLISTMILQM